MSFQDTMARLRATYANDPRLGKKSWEEELAGIPGDFLSGLGSMIGIEPSPDQIIRQRKYPLSTFIAETAGFAVPYGAAYKAIGAIPKLDKAIKGLEFFGSAASAPIKTAMVDAAARTGVVELGRIGLNAAIPGGQDLGDMAMESLFNVGFGAGVSGFVGALAQGGKRAAPLQEIFKDMDLGASPQIQTRQLSQALTEGKIDPKFTNDAKNRLAKLSDNIRTQVPPAGVKYVGPTSASGGSRLNRLFSFGDKQKSGVVRRYFGRSVDKGFVNDAAWQSALNKVGLPPDWVKYSQYPRHVSAKSEGAAKHIQNTVYQTMSAAGDGWYMTREQNDGLFVLAKRVSGQPSKPAPNDEWFFVKTDKPGEFRPGYQQWQDAVADHMNFMAKPPKPKGPVNDIYDSARAMQETMPLRRLVDSGAMKGSAAEMSSKLSKVMGLEGALKPTGEMTKRVKDFFVEHLAPTVQQFGRSPRAGRAFAIARATYDAAESTMRRLVYGEKNLDPTKGPFTHVFGKQESLSGDSIKKAIEGLTDDDVKQFWQITKQQAPLDAVEKLWADGKISDKTRDFAKLLDGIDKDVSGQIMRVEEATGGGRYKPAEGHYMMSHRWEGDNRVAIRGPDDRLVGVAAGQSRVGAQKEAQRLLKQLEGEGQTGLHVAEEFDITNTSQLPKDLKLQVNSPAWSLERQNVRGFKWDEKAFDKRELLDELAQNVQRRTKYMAERTVSDVLADDIARVAIEDPTMHRILVGRLNDLTGAQTPAAKLMNQAVDSVLGPIMGKNTASKVVSATNKFMWHLELGGLRVAYPVMNMMSFIQTTIPEIAYVQSAKPEVLSKYYDVFTMGGNKVKPGGILSPLKLMWAGTKQMKSKDKDFLKGIERGLNEGVIDPKFIEEFGGDVAGKVANMKDALKSPGGFTNWLEALSEYMPAQSEKFSRLQSFSTGWVVGKELMGATDPELLYRFAKQFTDRSMFRYGMDARPRLFTTPAGSALGLFKNWMMHYVGTMLDYTAEGAMRNNWAPLLWQTAGTAAVGGATAMPLWAVANGMSQAFSDKSALVNGYEMMDTAGVPENFSDAIFFGLPALAGISMSSNAAAPFSNPMRDVTQMMSLVHMDRINAAAKFFTHAGDHVQATGESPFSDPNTRDMFFRAFAPKTMYRLAATAEDGVIKSLASSTPVLNNVGMMDKVFFTLGFNPLQIEKAYAVADELWADQAKMKKAVQTYGEAMAQAYTAGDMKQVENIAMRAMTEGIDISSIERSAMSRMAKAEKDVVTRNFKPEEIEQRLVVMGDNYKPPQE